LKTLVENGSFSTNNIVFKLLQDSLRWHACSNVSAMRYSEEVKQFFWTGRRLLGGQFMRFMRGYGHQGMVVQGTVPRGIYSPLGIWLCFSEYVFFCVTFNFHLFFKQLYIAEKFIAFYLISVFRC
jgi:hypothetical protein